jgi:hypothetical protein
MKLRLLAVTTCLLVMLNTQAGKQPRPQGLDLSEKHQKTEDERHNLDDLSEVELLGRATTNLNMRHTKLLAEIENILSPRYFREGLRPKLKKVQDLTNQVMDRTDQLLREREGETINEPPAISHENLIALATLPKHNTSIQEME